MNSELGVVADLPLTRRELLWRGAVSAAGVTVLGALAGCGASAGTASPSAASIPSLTPPTTADEALKRLMDGNARFVADATITLGEDKARRLDTAEHQSPFAIVVGCSDSRVPPELLFDQGIGDIFTVRVAGNTAAAPAVMGSIEYAAEHLGSLIVVVLGHESCGAVKATIDHVLNGASEHGSIPSLVEPIVPAVQAVKDQAADKIVDAAVQQNAKLQAQAIATSAAILQPLVAAGRLKVIPAEYHLATGQVAVLG